MSETAATGFKGYALVEVMGHNRYAGYVTEEVIAGQAFVRVDVPEVPEQPPLNQWSSPRPAVAGYTKYFGAASIYSLTPCTFETAQMAANQWRSEPAQVWVPTPETIEARETPKMLTAAGTELDIPTERPTCSCRYCQCCEDVEFDGETCQDCQSGCHQG